jgi:hypothetical protein
LGIATLEKLPWLVFAADPNRKLPLSRRHTEAVQPLEPTTSAPAIATAAAKTTSHNMLLKDPRGEKIPQTYFRTFESYPKKER